MKTNYRRVYHRLKRRFPAIEHMVNPPGKLRSLAEIPELYSHYLQVAGITDEQLRRNENNYRLIFIAVITRMEDPLFLSDNLPVRRGLRTELARTLCCDQTIISHALQRVKNYMSIYPEFTFQVDYFYGKMTEG